MFRPLLLALAIPFIALAADPAPSRIPRWSRFELAVKNSSRASDPYRDVTLDVIYTAPDGRTIAFWGFYDGGDTWRARFMPDTLGTWRYEAKLTETTRTDPSGATTSTRNVTT